MARARQRKTTTRKVITSVTIKKKPKKGSKRCPTCGKYM